MGEEVYRLAGKLAEIRRTSPLFVREPSEEFLAELVDCLATIVARIDKLEKEGGCQQRQG